MYARICFLGHTSSFFHPISMLFFTASLSKELLTYIYTYVPLPHLTFSPEPQLGFCPLTLKSIPSSSTLSCMLSPPCLYLIYPFSTSPHIRPTSLVWSISLLSGLLLTPLSPKLSLPTISRTVLLASKSWRAPGLRPGFLCLPVSLPLGLVQWSYWTGWWLCLSWLCPWTSHSYT